MDMFWFKFLLSTWFFKRFTKTETKSTIFELQQRYNRPFWKWQANSFSTKCRLTSILGSKDPIFDKNWIWSFGPFFEIQKFCYSKSQIIKTFSMVLNSQHKDKFRMKIFLNSRDGLFGNSIFGDFFLEKMKKIQNFGLGGSNIFWPPKNMGDGCSTCQVSWISHKPSWLWGMGENTLISPFWAMPDFQKKL